MNPIPQRIRKVAVHCESVNSLHVDGVLRG